ncbi:hypothetical protein PInf_008847 [Phytophthora infestans]|nr:hypothetical protein PInf_008847 [Phytophthora infestans]
MTAPGTAPGKLPMKRSHVEAFKWAEGEGDEQEEDNWVDDDDDEQGVDHESAQGVALAEDKPPAVSGKKDIPDVKIRYKVPDVPLATEYNGGEFYFVRGCYDVYYKKVEDRLLNDKKKCVTVTGTPGIGKSIFYAYFLERFRKANPSWTIIASAHTPTGKVESLAVFEPGEEAKHYRRPDSSTVKTAIRKVEGVDLSDETTLDRYREKLLWLCDGPPKVAFRQTVVFTNPNERWLKRVRKTLCTYYMPPWSLKELQLAASVLEYPISDDEMEERFWNFGGVARNCFLLKQEQVVLTIKDLTKPIEQITDRGHLENLLMNRENTIANHRFLHYEPVDDGRSVETKLVSEMVSKRFSERLLGVIEGRMNEVKALLDGIPPAASLRGSMFEAKAHAKLRDGLQLKVLELKAQGVFTVKTRQKRETFDIERSDPADNFEHSALSSLLLKKGPYHQPKSKTMESIDGFYFPKTLVSGKRKQSTALSMNMSSKRILLFQMTVSKTHPVRAFGIIYVLDRLGLLELVKTNSKRAALVFMVPQSGMKDFERQNVIADEVSPHSIKDIKGIGPATASTLAEYGINTVVEFKAAVGRLDQGETVIKEKKHESDWSRAVKRWEAHKKLDKAENITMVENIPQYVAPSD